MTDNSAPAKTTKGKELLWTAVVIVVIVGLCCGGSLLLSGSGGSDTVQPPAATDTQQVVADLSRAATAHGICYGWQLLDAGSLVSSGSNLGVGVKVADNPDKCPKYVEVRGTYHYYSDSSESEDYARYSIASNLSGASGLDANAFDRLGAGTDRLLDDPPTTILNAAEALPLLTQEAGLAGTPVPEPSLTGSAAPLTTGGSDFWRDRWVLMLVAGLLLLAAAGALLLGIRSSRRIKRGEEPDVFASAQPEAAPPGTAQPETAPPGTAQPETEPPGTVPPVVPDPGVSGQ